MSARTTTSSPKALNVALFVEPEAIDRFGRVLRNLLVGLVEQTIHLCVVSTDWRVERFSLGPVQSVRYEKPIWPIAGRRIEQLLDRLSPDPPMVVHATSGSAYHAAGEVARAFDADLVVQVSSLPDCSALAVWQGPAIAKYVAMTQSLATALTEQVSLPADRVQLVHPGVLCSQTATCFIDSDRIPAVVCLTPFEPDRGLDVLLQAVQRLIRRERSLMLFLIGVGRYESKIRRMIRDMKLSHQVSLAHPEGTLSRAIASADLFVKPSLDRTFYDDSLLAMASGTAVITERNPIYDHLLHDETALVCDQTTVDSLAGALERLLIDHTLARKIARGGMEYVRRHHAVSAMAEQTARMYRELVTARATFPLEE